MMADDENEKKDDSFYEAVFWTVFKDARNVFLRMDSGCIDYVMAFTVIVQLAECSKHDAYCVYVGKNNRETHEIMFPLDLSIEYQAFDLVAEQKVVTRGYFKYLMDVSTSGTNDAQKKSRVAIGKKLMELVERWNGNIAICCSKKMLFASSSLEELLVKVDMMRM